MGHDVFISHSSKDKHVADAVCAALEANGVRCWVAPRDINPGENWPSAILRGIAGCRMMVLIFSRHTNSSQHICREVERAVHGGIPIAPLRIEDVMPKDDLEYFLSSSHWIDALTPPLQQHLQQFTEKVRGLLEVSGSAPPGAVPDLSAEIVERRLPVAAAPTQGRGRVPVLLGLAVVLAGTGVAGWAFRGQLAHRAGDPAQIGPTLTSAAAPLPVTVPAVSPVAQPPAPADLLLTGLMDAANPAAPFKVTVEAQMYRSQLNDCTCVGLTITADADCYVLLVDRDSSGRISVLLPNGVVDRCPLIGRGQSVTVQSLGFELPVEAPYGRTTFKVIATTRRVALEGAKPNSARFLEGATALSVEDRSGTTAAAVDELLGQREWNVAQVEVVTHAPG